MTPYELTILLDIYVGRPVSVETQAPLYIETIADLCDRHFIRELDEFSRPDGILYAPTGKLDVLIEHMLDLPEPVWSMP